ncbi:MAG: CcmD family protein [Ferruginibacter sp.]
MRKFVQHIPLFALRLLLTLFIVMTAAVGFAQDKVEMADTMRSNGKIYVVVAVCVTILIGLFLYVFALDRKISKLEKKG